MKSSASAAKLSRRGALEARRLLNPNLTSPFSETEHTFRSLLSDCEKNSNPHLKKAVSIFRQALDSNTSSLSSPGNNLIATLVRSKNHELAFSVYRKMLEANAFINFVSLSGLLECLLRLHHRNTDFAVGVLAVMLKRGFTFNVYNLNVILKGLCKNLEFGKALTLLRDMRRLDSPGPDVVSYNTVIRGLCEGGELERALELGKEMDSWNLITCGILVDAFCKAGKMGEAMVLFEEMRVSKGLEPDLVLYTTLIRGFCDCCEVGRAKEVFDEVMERGLSPTAITYNTLIQGFCKLGEMREASEMFEFMKERGVSPNVYTYTGLISGLCGVGKTKEALQLLNLMLENGEEPNVVTYNVILTKLCKDGLVGEAFEVVELMKKRGTRPDVIAYNILLGGLCAKGELEEASKLLCLLVNDGNYPDPDVRSFNALIHGLCEDNNLYQALEFYDLLVEKLGVADVVTTNILLKGTLKSGDVMKAMEVWKQVPVPNSDMYSTMIDGFCKTGMLNVAKGLFCKMRGSKLRPSVYDYNCLLSSLCKEGSLDQAWRLFEEMQRDDSFLPDVVSFNIMIDGSLRAGDVESAESLLVGMYQAGLSPDLFTYSKLINRFLKLGYLEEAIGYFDRMVESGFEPDAHICDSVLKYCISQGDSDKVKELVEKLVEKDIVLDKELTCTVMEYMCSRSSADVDPVKRLLRVANDKEKRD